MIPLGTSDRASFVDLLGRFYARLTAEEMLREALTRDLPGRVALVSSFGAESVALLHLVSEIEQSTPVLFLDTEMLFPETLTYQRRVAETLGLTDVRIIRPDWSAVNTADPRGDLHRSAPDACCTLRKVEPLAQALEPFDGWITGRKRAQGGERIHLPKVELDGSGRVKLNPLADWTPEDVSRHIDQHDLPRHPLVERGFQSIGCAPCTTAVRPGEDARAGRWRGGGKTECGIHFAGGRATRDETVLKT